MAQGRGEGRNSGAGGFRVPDAHSPCGQTSACHVSKSPNFSTVGQWDVVTESMGKQKASVFDTVTVASHQGIPRHCPGGCLPRP